MAFLRRNCPMGRGGEADELDGVLLFLAGDASSLRHRRHHPRRRRLDGALSDGAAAPSSSSPPRPCGGRPAPPRELLADDAPPVGVGAVRLAVGGAAAAGAWRRPVARGVAAGPLVLAVGGHGRVPAAVLLRRRPGRRGRRHRRRHRHVARSPAGCSGGSLRHERLGAAVVARPPPSASPAPPCSPPPAATTPATTWRSASCWPPAPASPTPSTSPPRPRCSTTTAPADDVAAVVLGLAGVAAGPGRPRRRTSAGSTEPGGVGARRLARRRHRRRRLPAAGPGPRRRRRRRHRHPHPGRAGHRRRPRLVVLGERLPAAGWVGPRPSSPPASPSRRSGVRKPRRAYRLPER